MTELPDRDGFVGWLRSKGPDEAAGRSNSDNSCPLACYVVSRGLQDVHMGSLFFDSFTVSGRLPAWASAFVAALDAAYPTRVPVPAAECLRILGEPTAEDLAVSAASRLVEREAVPI